MSRRLALADVAAIQEIAPDVAWLAVERLEGFKLREPPGGHHGIRAEGVSDGFFANLGVAPATGNLATRNEHPAVVVDYRLGQRLRTAAGALPDALAVEDNGLLPLIGVAPPGFSGVTGESARLWVLNPRALPANVAKNDLEKQIDAVVPSQLLFGVLPPDGSLSAESLQALLADFRVAQGFAADNAVGTNLAVTDDDRLEVTAGLEANPALRLEVLARIRWLVAVALFLFALALVGLLEHLLAEQRIADRELAVRVAAGAAPARLFGESCASNAVWLVSTALIAGVSSRYLSTVLLGVEPFASWLGELSKQSVAAGFAIGAAALALTFAVAIGAAVRAVVAVDSVLCVRRRYRQTVRRMLLFAAAASLLFVASVLVRYAQEANRSLGFQNRHAELVFVSSDQGTPAEDVARDAIMAVPLVRSVGRMDLIPLVEWVERRNRVTLSSHPDLADVDFVHSGVTPGYFSALGVELLSGRILEYAGEAVIGRSTALRLGAGDLSKALGATVHMRREIDHAGETLAVVGIVADISYGRYLDVPLNVIYSHAQASPWDQRWVVDHAGRTQDLIAALRASRAFEGYDLFELGTPASLFDKQFMAVRSVEILLAGAASLAFVLSLAGIVNSQASGLAEDRHALGIGLALGATPWALADRYVGESVSDLFVAVVLPFGGFVALTVAHPALGKATELLNWWLAVPVAAVVFAVSVAAIYCLARRYASGGANVYSLLQAGGGVGRR